MARVDFHHFRALVWHDRIGQRGRCRACYCPRYAHPTLRWEPARAWGTKWGVRWPFKRARFMR